MSFCLAGSSNSIDDKLEIVVLIRLGNRVRQILQKSIPKLPSHVRFCILNGLKVNRVRRMSYVMDSVQGSSRGHKQKFRGEVLSPLISHRVKGEVKESLLIET